MHALRICTPPQSDSEVSQVCETQSSVTRNMKENEREEKHEEFKGKRKFKNSR